ncbi:MAG: hypothetical protein CVU89_04350 [Firmicutes bacterium HGW-Firmicutes-14]|nr:MAG: hypothetical protein CVU89_04350 [Firmicutes bacterium HGW-Firmicutes-14]
MNKYSQILIINFVIINVIAALFNSIFASNSIVLGLPVIMAVTLGVVVSIGRSLINLNPGARKTVTIFAIPGFLILMIINTLVANGTANVVRKLF